MTTRDLWMLAIGNVRRGGSKSLLCALAVCVAICSVCMISGLGSAAQSAVVSEIEQTGLGGLALYADSDGFIFDQEELGVICSNVAQVSAAMPLALKYGYVTQRGETFTSGILGVSEQLTDIFNLTLLHGRMLQKSDISGASKVVVIDRTLAEALYQRENIVGKTLLIGTEDCYDRFEVIGVIDSQTESIRYLTGGRVPYILYLPYTALDEMLGQSTTDKLAINWFANVGEDSAVQDAIQQLHQINPDIEFKYENLGGYTDIFKRIVKIITIFISAVAAISMIVGGIGVMNSMVSSVEHRTREIGVYMALGATRRDILRCFLWEAVIICLIGGLSGGTISLTAFYILGQLLDLKINMLGSVILCVGCAAICGLTFGIAPARKACQMNPIDAIREE